MSGNATAAWEKVRIPPRLGQMTGAEAAERFPIEDMDEHADHLSASA
jgi:hypothetical protein